MYLWVAFNALYGQRRARDWPDVEVFLGLILNADPGRVRQDLLDLHDEAIALLRLEFLYFGYWAWGFTESVAETITGHVLRAEFSFVLEDVRHEAD